MPQLSGVRSRVTAVLGATNTGKTHYAIERMLAYRTGMIGLPLRLLAREVYDRIVAVRGPSVVALITGEERIVPERAAYWVCTVEAMPVDLGVDFMAIDEIQLCADPDRGHVFTDRLLNARGTHETIFLGASTMRQAIRQVEPRAEFLERDRFSELTYSGSKKLSRMPGRSAIVGFSVDSLYAIAELLRRTKGGAAVVMGALSPRTRNAQVALYQNGDVEYLVATDAIGMGLNLDIDHVAFSSLRKFDGAKMRQLYPEELGQVAGRAGRYRQNGTFGVTGEAPELADDMVEAIENHHFTPISRLFWRNSRLSFGSIPHLLRSLDVAPGEQIFSRGREAEDVAALRSLANDAETRARASDPASVRLLWDVCQLPDFRNISRTEHADLVRSIFGYLHEFGRIPDVWFADRVQRIDNPKGNIDTLSKRLAYIRTWTYVAQRNGWLRDETHWREVTRAVEDRLSDALHGALTQRFVDRRTSVLMRRLKQKESLVAEVSESGDVTVDGEFIGRLEGFRFRMDKAASPDETKTLRQASLVALAPHYHLRADRLYNAPDTEMDFTEQGGLMWGTDAVGKLVPGDEPFKPKVVAFVDDDAAPEVREKVQRRLQHFIDRKIATLFEPMFQMRDDEALPPAARGFAFRLSEHFGIVERNDVAQDVRDLDQETRGTLRKHGVRFGQYTIFMPLMLKPAPTRLRLVLWSLSKGLQEFPEAPPPGLVTVPVPADIDRDVLTMSGFRGAGERAIRVDMLERLADILRLKDSRGGFEATPEMLSITGLTLKQFSDLMQGLGYKAERGEREKVKPAPEAAEVATDSTPDNEGEAAEAAPEAPAAELAEAPEAAAQEAAQETPAQETAPELDVFYTFTWGGQRAKPKVQPRGKAGAGDRAGGKPGGKRGKQGGKPGQKGGKPRAANAGGGRKPEKKIDPDNPFAAALSGFKPNS